MAARHCAPASPLMRRRLAPRWTSRRRRSSSPIRSSCFATSRATVLPSAIGRKGQDEAVDNFLRWIRDYKEGVPLSHGYGEPRLVKSGPSPAPGYAKQIAALQQAAQGARRPLRRAADRRSRRELLDAAFKAADVRNLPGPSRRQARRRRSDGALLPQQRRQRSLLQRAHRAQHLSRHSRDHRAAAAAERRARALALATPCLFTNPTSASSAAASRRRC